MKRRDLLLSALATLPAVPAFSAKPPWSAKLLQGGFDGRVWWSGLMVTMDPGWKTYWRVPGDGGIAPQFDIKGQNLKSSTVRYPLPHRYADANGIAIGYKGEVVFPIALEPADASAPLAINIGTFFGVCEVICIPAQVNGALTFDPGLAGAGDQAAISRWFETIPTAAPEPVVRSAALEDHDGKPVLVLALASPVADIFVEGNPMHYFGAPVFKGNAAMLPVTGAKSLDEIKVQPLRLTLDAGGKPLEQMLSVV